MTKKIITISREFGSGGRELGKRLADELGFAYFDREIVTEIAHRIHMDEKYVSTALEKGVFLGIPVHYGQTFGYISAQMQDKANLIVATSNLLKEIAEIGDCVIVGRAASAILQEYHPFNIFVYADIEHRINRCQQYSDSAETLNDNEIKEKIQQLDTDRARYHEMFSKIPWGDKSGYHLCINSSCKDVKTLASSVANYIRDFYK